MRFQKDEYVYDTLYNRVYKIINVRSDIHTYVAISEGCTTYIGFEYKHFVGISKELAEILSIGEVTTLKEHNVLGHSVISTIMDGSYPAPLSTLIAPIHNKVIP